MLFFNHVTLLVQEKIIYNMFEPISEDKLYLKKIIIKTIFYDVLFISCICTLICIYAFVFKEPFAVYIKSAVCGCSIFL